MDEIEQPKEWDYQSKCNRCGGSDTQYDGTVNMVDGKYGLCANCADEMKA